jgi:hypothetical protein
VSNLSEFEKLIPKEDAYHFFCMPGVTPEYYCEPKIFVNPFDLLSPVGERGAMTSTPKLPRDRKKVKDPLKWSYKLCCDIEESHAGWDMATLGMTKRLYSFLANVGAFNLVALMAENGSKIQFPLDMSRMPSECESPATLVIGAEAIFRNCMKNDRIVQELADILRTSLILQSEPDNPLSILPDYYETEALNKASTELGPECHKLYYELKEVMEKVGRRPDLQMDYLDILIGYILETRIPPPLDNQRADIDSFTSEGLPAKISSDSLAFNCRSRMLKILSIVREDFPDAITRYYDTMEFYLALRSSLGEPISLAVSYYDGLRKFWQEFKSGKYSLGPPNSSWADPAGIVIFGLNSDYIVGQVDLFKGVNDTEIGFWVSEPIFQISNAEGVPHFGILVVYRNRCKWYYPEVGDWEHISQWPFYRYGFCNFVIWSLRKQMLYGVNKGIDANDDFLKQFGLINPLNFFQNLPKKKSSLKNIMFGIPK